MIVLVVALFCQYQKPASATRDDGDLRDEADQHEAGAEPPGTQKSRSAHAGRKPAANAAAATPAARPAWMTR